MDERVGWLRMLIAAAAVLCTAPVSAQPDGARWRPDSLEVAADAVPLLVETVRMDCRPVHLRVVRDSADVEEIRRFRGCDPSAFPGLGRDLYVYLVMMGDCHARHSVEAWRSDSRREYRIVMVDRYGGCRAGRIQTQWIRLPPLPDGWTVAFTELRIDGWNDDPWRTDSSGGAADEVPLPVAREWVDCDPPRQRVVRDSGDLRAIRHLPGCEPSAFPALGRELYVRVLASAVCDGPYDVHAYRSEARREYRVVRMHRSRACRTEGGGPRWYRLPPLPDGWTVAFSDR